MKPEDLYDLAWVADPRVSPDGTVVAYVVVRIDREANDYRSTIWLASLADPSAAPRPFTRGARRDAAPRWSPDGRWLAFTSNRDSDQMQLYVIPCEGGEARKLTDRKENVDEPVWSSDGTRVAFTSRVRDAAYDEEDERKRRPRRFTRLQYKLDNVGWTGDRRKHIFVVAADGSGEPVQLTDGDYEDSGPCWAPDGSRIAFASARHEDWDVEPRSDVYVVDASGGEPERVTHFDGSCAAPSWAPDGTRIAYQWTPGVWDSPHHTQIAVVDLQARERRVLTASLDRNCAPYPALREPIWVDERVLFGVEDHGNTHLCLVAADGDGEPIRAIEGELRVTGYDIAAGNGVHVATTPTSPPELYFGDKKLTDVSGAFVADRRPVTAERFDVTSPDGSPVDAWIMRPAGFAPGARYPALLNIHGGPFTQYGNGFFDEFQVWAGAGYVVLFSNPRGSSGSSEEWGRAIRGPADGGPGWGTVDVSDALAVVDEACGRFDFIDPDRIGVTGGSYGGFLTSWLVGHTNRFAAACSERAVNHWISMFGSSDFGWAFKGTIGTFAFEDPETYLKISPASHATRITTPLLILHSENDLRCPVEQAEHLFTILRLLRRDVELVRFPVESHELSRSGSPAHRVQRFEVILDWFARKMPAPEPVA